ncbi:MAG: ABC transporter permease subunit [Ferrimicrobium acidiphilum]
MRRSVPSWLSIVSTIAIWLILIGPLITLFAKLSPSEIVTALSQPGSLSPLGISVASAAIALAFIVLGGTPLAYALARSHRRGLRWLEAGMLLMLLMPPLVIGLLLVFMLGPLTPLGELLSRVHLSATNTFFALIVCEVYEAAPYYVLGAQSTFVGLDQAMLDQASLLGNTPRERFFRISLPLSLPQLSSSLAIAWARAIGAFGAVVIVAYHPYGLPMQVWTTLNEVGLSRALPYALVLLVVSLPLPLLAYAWSRFAQR